MSTINDLRKLTSLRDLANYLEITPKNLSYIIYIMPESGRYNKFMLPKKTGGYREISSPIPQLKGIQRKLADVLYLCIREIDTLHPLTKKLAHGFQEDLSIYTNALKHKNKRIIINIDLEDFFDSFNFGRVRGFFHKNSLFKLNEKVATTIAQICCDDNKLPQGAPTSPIVSNLISATMDSHIHKVCKLDGTTYTRYADDITLSTRRKSFSHDILAPYNALSRQIEIGEKIENIIARSGVLINRRKIRVQTTDNRQNVTGLTVNCTVNTPLEYRKNTRAMVHRVVNTGTYEIDAGIKGNLNQLRGRLSHIYSVYNGNKKKFHLEFPGSFLSTYACFLFYDLFYNNKTPMIITEGHTDIIYLKKAIQLSTKLYPNLINTDSNGKRIYSVSFLRNTDTIKSILGLTGGTGQIKKFLGKYKSFLQKIKAPYMGRGVIIVLDGDAGVDGCIDEIKKNFDVKIDKSLNNQLQIISPYVSVIIAGDIGRSIESLFDESILEKKIDGKSFSSGNKIDTSKEYGKSIFATAIVSKLNDHSSIKKFDPIMKIFSDIQVEISKTV